MGINNKLFFLIIITLYAPTCLGITFNISLATKAEIEIYISQKVPEFFSVECPIRVDTAQTIAQYALLITSQQKILLWQKLDDIKGFDVFIKPRDFFIMPSRHDNPFSITLSTDQIKQIVDKSLDQVYVLIRQRTYMYNGDTQRISFFAYAILKQAFMPVNTTVSIQASGIIAPSKFNDVPNFLKPFFPIASGSVSP